MKKVYVLLSLITVLLLVTIPVSADSPELFNSTILENPIETKICVQEEVINPIVIDENAAVLSAGSSTEMVESGNIELIGTGHDVGTITNIQILCSAGGTIGGVLLNVGYI